MFKKVSLDYDFTQFVDADYTGSDLSCISYQVVELKDIHEQYGGFPDSYVLENTRIYQLWWSQDQVDFKSIGDQLGIEVVTISTIMQPPGGVIPWHRDTFYKIKQMYPQRANEPMARANIHLQDWKMGHFIQYSNEVFTHWKQGDGLMWDETILHLGANAGFEPKFTMQISGFKIDL